MSHSRWYTELEDFEQDLLSHHAEILTDRQYVLGVLREVYAEHPWDVSLFFQQELLQLERGWTEKMPYTARVYSVSALSIEIVGTAACNLLAYTPRSSLDYQLFKEHSTRLLSYGWFPTVNEIALEYA